MGPRRAPRRDFDQPSRARARASRPELYASLEFSAHHGATTCFARFHSLGSAGGDHGATTVADNTSASPAVAPSTSVCSPSRPASARRAITKSRPQLNANREAPAWPANAERTASLGSSWNRNAWNVASRRRLARRRHGRLRPPLG